MLTNPPTILLPSLNPPQSPPIDLEQQVSTCPVCLDQYPNEQISHIKACNHSFCLDCLKEYLLCQIKSNKVLNIPCPQSNCPEILQDQLIRSVLSQEDYNKYMDLVLKKIAVRNPEEKYCPSPGCSRVFKPNLSQEFTLCECGAKVCNTCNNIHHPGKTCIEALDVEFEQYAKDNNIRFCIMCKSMILRDGGCTEMKCAVCDYEFCWLCGRELDHTHACTGKWNPIPPSIVREGDPLAAKYKGPKTGSLFFGLFEPERDVPGRRRHAPGAETMVKIKEKWARSTFMKKILLVLGSPLILIWSMIVFPTLREYGNIQERTCKDYCFIVTNGLMVLPFTLLTFVITALFDVVLLVFSCLTFCIRPKKKIEPGEEDVDPKNRWMSRNANHFVYRKPEPH